MKINGAPDKWLKKATLDGVAYYHNEGTGQISWDEPGTGGADAADNWYWVPDAKMGYVAGEKVGDAADGGITVKLESGSTKSVPKGSKVFPVLRSALARIEQDLVLLDTPDEGMICHTLRQRFADDGSGFYTAVGSILVAVNPFKYYDLYAPELMHLYHRPGNRQLKPHVFQIAAAAHKTLTLEQQNAAILISGESGTGKTEATKHCLSFLAEVAGSESNVESQVLQANPLMEAFGNAKTLRNNNSSRFGKWIEIRFDSAGSIASARIDEYLLEKSRVPFQQKGERNYHIFYQLIDSMYCAPLQLQTASTYRFLHASGTFKVHGINDKQDFEQMLSAMSGLGFDQAEVDGVMHVVAGVLTLGQMGFEKAKVGEGTQRQEGCKLTAAGEPFAADLARLWEVAETAVRGAVTRRTIEVRGTGTEIPLKAAEAPEVCMAFAKTVYGKLFAWLVQRINAALGANGGGGGGQGRFLGVLDIFGFEIFDVNGFEQLCINYANEKLQQLFNLHTFKQEEKLYVEEGIKFAKIAFIDNQPVLDLIEGTGKGLLVLLNDEAVKMGGQGSDESFIDACIKTHDPDANRAKGAVPKGTSAAAAAEAEAAKQKEKLIRVYTKIEVQKDKDGGGIGFQIKHYAGPVRYATTGFLIRTKDPVSPDLKLLLEESDNVVMNHLFPRPKPGERRAPTSRTTLGAQFKGQLNTLMETLRTTTPHFIRCIKPNAEKKPKLFNGPMVLEQLTYAGVFEAVKIRKNGYPFRFKHERFVQWYKCIMMDPNEKRRFVLPPFSSTDVRARIRQILAASEQGDAFSEVEVGKSMVLYRAKEHRVLELLRNLAIERVLPLVQRVTRGFCAREFKRRAYECRAWLKAGIVECEDVYQIDAVLRRVGERMGTIARLFFELDELQQLAELRRAMQQWATLEEALPGLIGAVQDGLKLDPLSEAGYPALETAVLKGEEIKEVRHTQRAKDLFAEARKLLDLSVSRKLNPEAAEATWILDRARLEAVRDEAARLKFTSAELDKVKELLAKDEESFLKLQVARSVELQDRGRIVNRQIELRRVHLANHAANYKPEHYGRLRAPVDFATRQAGLLGKSKVPELAKTMLSHQRNPIKTSLTLLDGPIAKTACAAFKALLGYTGDRPNANPDGVALQFLTAGYDNPDVQAELYMQIIKQLTDSPTEFCRTQCWNMLVLCLWNYAPPHGLDDFLTVFCLEQHAEGHRFVSLMHKTQNEGALYGSASRMPSYEQLPAILNGFFSVEQTRSRSRWSIDEGTRPVSLDDGLMTRMRMSMSKIGYPEGATGVLGGRAERSARWSRRSQGQ